MKNIDNIEFHLTQLKLAYKNLESQQRIVEQWEKSLELAIKDVEESEKEIM